VPVETHFEDTSTFFEVRLYKACHGYGGRLMFEFDRNYCESEKEIKKNPLAILGFGILGNDVGTKTLDADPK